MFVIDLNISFKEIDMPYIKQEQRKKFDSFLEQINTADKGELEYCIYKLMVQHMKKRDFRYRELHDITYASQHCADEFRRNYLDKREDIASQKNGKI